MMLKSLLLLTCLSALCYHTSGQETIDLSQLTPEELQIIQAQQVSGPSGGALAGLGGLGGGLGSSGGSSTTFYDRLMTVVQPIRNFNLRETVTGFFRRITTFLFPVQTVQSTARDGTPILKPEIEDIIENLVDKIFEFGESYFSQKQ